MKIRAKFKVESVTISAYGESVKMKAVCYDGTAENASFSKYTPAGNFDMMVTNEALFGAFKPDIEYYFDMTPVPVDPE